MRGFSINGDGLPIIMPGAQRVAEGADAMDQVFVGRHTELALLRTRLQAAQGGTLQLMLVVGAAGVGKTALLGAFLAATDQRVVRASGDNLESGLAYGVIQQLASDVGRPLPERLTVLGTDYIADTHPVQVGADLVDLLGCLQADGPVILAVDDVHWADRESLQALVFALRRMRTDRVLVLLAARDDLVERLPASLHRLLAGPAGARLRLGGLAIAELRALSRALGAGSLSTRAAGRLREHTGGNPLHAKALLEELPASALHYTGHPLPAPRSFRKLVLARLAACPADAEPLVVAAAVLGTHCPLALASQLAEVDDPLPALEQAIHVRLLEERPTTTELQVAFPHPLVHAAVYHDLGPARRARLHARAAQLVADEAAAVRHRVAAARGPDPSLAAELITLAGEQALAGAWAAAADSLLTAARLGAAQAERERLVLQAVDQLLLSGNALEAAAVADEVAAFSNSTRRDYVAARLAMASGRHADAEPLLARAWQHSDLATQPDLTAAIAEQLAFYGLLHADGEQAVTWARRALAAAPPNPVIPSNLQDILTVGLAMAGRAPEALALTAALPDPAAAPSPAGPDGWIGRSIALAWTDDLPGARGTLTAALAAYRHRGAPLPWALIGLGFLAEFEYRLGTWDDAIAHAELAVTLARDTDQDQGGDWLAAFIHAVAAFPLAARGAYEAAAHASAAATHAERAGGEQSTIWVATARVLLALANGDDHRIVAALEPLQRLPVWAAAGEPGWQAWPALYAEALVALGRCDQAEAALVPFEARAAARGRRSAQATAARARGTLEAARGRHEQAEAAYRTGLAYARNLPLPFDRALLEAAYGRFLRRTGRRAGAVAHLTAARAWLARLDAQPYLERCDRELAACGRPPARRQPGPRATLTPQELAVARLVAAGRTNRQAAAALVISVKTIEYHLSNAYAKLAVTSRTQLALALRQDEGNP
jgi:DNA-binding CsgD family transcriptional regulator